MTTRKINKVAEAIAHRLYCVRVQCPFCQKYVWTGRYGRILYHIGVGGYRCEGTGQEPPPIAPSTP